MQLLAHVHLVCWSCGADVGGAVCPMTGYIVLLTTHMSTYWDIFCHICQCFRKGAVPLSCFKLDNAIILYYIRKKNTIVC